MQLTECVFYIICIIYFYWCFIGANTCEACKAFFRRSIGHEDGIKPCQADGKCGDNPTGKISCSECRHKKCLAIGMAKEGMCTEYRI